jgi:transketolase
MDTPDASKARNVNDLARRIRLNATRMVAIQGFGYLGQALGAAEIFAVMFKGKHLRLNFDRFVLSPGHYIIVFYAVAAELGLIERRDLENYGKDGALLEAISTERTPFVDITCGSLGQGLSGAIGLAMAARFANDGRRVYAFLSDGEMEEGQVWEAAMFAAHQRLSNLVVVVDANNSQVDGTISSVTTIDPLKEKWAAFGWQAHDINGHDPEALDAAFEAAERASQPTVIIARTDILGRLTSIPSTVDAHFIKLDPVMTEDVIRELQRV